MMKKNSTLQQKLKSYSAVAAGTVAATALSTDANAQVVYTDVAPDVTVNTGGSGYQLDLDNNGVFDFTIAYLSGVYYGYTYNYVLAYSGALSATNQIDTTASSDGAPPAHDFGDVIGATSLWNVGYGAAGQHLLAIELVGLGTGGNWLGVTDKYLACKFDISGTTHYGWARLDVAAGANSFTIKDYAYDGTANAPILAGDMGVTGMVNSKLENVRVFAANSIINVNMGSIEAANVTVHDMMGKEVYSAQLNSSINRLDLSGTATGIYNVTIVSEGKTFTKKVTL